LNKEPDNEEDFDQYDDRINNLYSSTPFPPGNEWYMSPAGQIYVQNLNTEKHF
jgi:hypothetical protein